MDNQIILTQNELLDAASVVASQIINSYGITKIICIFPIPRGGVPSTYLVQRLLDARGCKNTVICNRPIEADIFIDDLVDSGATRSKFQEMNPNAGFYTLFNKQTDNDVKGKWLVFPWEETAEKGMEEHIVRLLEFVGEDATRLGLLETPKRVLKALKEKTSGYGVDTGALLKTFTDGAEGCDEMVIVKDIPFHSMCEHHMENISGYAAIAYIPDGKIA